MSVYRVTEVIGTSTTSWADAANTAIDTAKETLHDLRVAEVLAQDIELSDGAAVYRVKLGVSFKYHVEDR